MNRYLKITDDLNGGDYLAKYDDHTDKENEGSRCGYSDQELGEIRGCLRHRGLALRADDQGLLVVDASDGAVNYGTELIVPANPDLDDCLGGAAEEYVEEHPELAGYDLDPRWGDADRETVKLTVPAWHTKALRP